MHIFGIPTVEEEDIPEEVGDLDHDNLLDLQHELHAAVMYHSHAQTYGDHAYSHETFFGGGGASEEATQEKVRNESQFKDLMNSDIYRSAVEEIADRKDKDIDTTEVVGWMDMPSEDKEALDYALENIAHRDVADKVGPIDHPEEEEVEDAMEILDNQEVDGYFVGTEDINREFTAQYTFGPSRGGEWS